MSEMSQEWLEFLRKQYPQGTRIRLEQMRDDPRPPAAGSIGTLDHIDDACVFHVRWDNGRYLGLVVGADSFAIMPPEVTTLKLYMPMSAHLYEQGEWDDPENEGVFLDGRELLTFASQIMKALVDNRRPVEADRGIMHWYSEEDTVNDKVKSAVFTAEEREGRLWAVAECIVQGKLTADEMNTLMNFISGQASDGWGEVFEQENIQTHNGELNVHLWRSDNWSIMTEEDRFDPDFAKRLPDMCWSVSQVDGKLICIKRGESGYYLSSWDTGDVERNRQIADYNNRERGITKAQERAMYIGSMFGWNTPAADPARYEEQAAPQMGGMEFC